MFRTAGRYFSTAKLAFAEAKVKIQPYLASKQFIPENATRSRIKALKKKENRLKRQVIREVNNLKKHNLQRVSFNVDPVLGDPACDFVKRIRSTIEDPGSLAQGYKRDEVEKLMYGAEKALLEKSGTSNVLNESLMATEARKRRAILTILNPKNTNSQDKKKIAIEAARREFEREEGDTGSSEVQAAILTVKIHFGMDHIKKNFKDKPFIGHVRQLVHKRQRILKYLKSNDAEKYFYTISKLGLTDDVIVREFNMDKQYFQDYNVWEGKVLVKLSEKQQRKEAKFVELQKRVAEYNNIAKKNYERIQGLISVKK